MINAIGSNLSKTLTMNAAPSAPPTTGLSAGSAHDPELRKAFNDFVGETFFSQLLQSMRKTVGKPAYFYGGRAEEIFQQQLDRVLAKKISDTSADQFSGPMFELFNMQRK